MKLISSKSKEMNEGFYDQGLRGKGGASDQYKIRSNKDVISLDIINLSCQFFKINFLGHAKLHFFTLKITNNELETLNTHKE